MYIILYHICKILKNTENACKILKNGKIYTERQESSLEALTVWSRMPHAAVHRKPTAVAAALWYIHTQDDDDRLFTISLD